MTVCLNKSHARKIPFFSFGTRIPSENSNTIKAHTRPHSNIVSLSLTKEGNRLITRSLRKLACFDASNSNLVRPPLYVNESAVSLKKLFGAELATVPRLPPISSFPDIIAGLSGAIIQAATRLPDMPISTEKKFILYAAVSLRFTSRVLGRIFASGSLIP